MYKALINTKTLDGAIEDNGTFTIDGNTLPWDCIKIADRHLHILYKNKSYRAEVIRADYLNKTFVIQINGHPYTVALRDKLDLLVEKMGMNNKIAGKDNAIRSPMPGLIIDIRVGVGDNVKAGDPILVLEAMKMENTLTASADGQVKYIKIKKGDSVEKGQVLIAF